MPPTSIEYSLPAVQALKRIPEPDRGRIRGKIKALAEDRQAQANNVKMLHGYDGMWRLRVGDWRVLYRDDVDVLRIMDIKARGNAYRKGKR
ncbi:MAG TPA: type II toxin-antitoxin system RelE/ParE family toxin [Amaricoccus sp.]|nr:type II toxin-antitoxin system RelE/ParE family toxin [Amaricoccus sp.]